jgi:hypothetical protein
MKLTHFIFLALAIALFSCREEIEGSKDGKVTAVVYGLLDQTDTLHFVKITRAFYGGGNSLDIAKIEDSSYFKTVNATVKEYQNGTLKRTWELKDTIIEDKKDGAFFGPKQKVYYFKTTISNPLIADGFTTYKLEANLDKGLTNECTVTGETKLLTGFNILDPSAAGSFKFASANIDLYGYTFTNVRISVGTAKRIEASLNVEIEEYAGNNLYNVRNFNWNLGAAEEDNLTSGQVEFTAGGESFYKLVSDNVTNDNNITKRILKSITIKTYACDQDFQKYLLVNKPSSGLAQNKPSFTNLSISNEMRVVGIFAARMKQERYFIKWKNTPGTSAYSRCLDPNSIKELSMGKITGTLKFCSDHPQDVSSNQPYACK